MTTGDMQHELTTLVISPWLDGVSNLTAFDNALRDYVANTYVTNKYVNQLGCGGLNKSALNDYYAQYTTSAICSGLVQSSIKDCNLSTAQSEPLCAETCALMATSEQEIMVNKRLCPQINKSYMSEIRSDFAICSNPSDSLTGSCVKGADNEPEYCGFASNTIGLCTYCASNSPNSTDTCCSSSHASTRCSGVSIPSSTVTLQPIVTSTVTAAAAASGHDGLSGGQIAGIVVGCILAAAILAALLVLLCLRRRRRSRDSTVLNRPNPQRKGISQQMQQAESPAGYNIVPGGRVARMSALREVPSSSPVHSQKSPAMVSTAKYSDTDSEARGASPGAFSRRIPPVTGKRHGSLSSSSALAGLDSESSPLSGTAHQFSSPEGFTSGQSEQLSFFRDYYSEDDIQPGDKVAVLWAYSPRAGDEFVLDRGEMLKVIGIWDDGWATGVRLSERAEDFDVRHREQRDSGVSSGSHRPAPSLSPTGEIKAFPLVCVCLPQHWRKIFEGGVPEED
ncbi:Uncharacterized protein PECH_005469 [Penicillium ucsense]|uniref:SH3 domain-containing protein n=1 Tax=Penicillium ucsense TaxID=2839758 RepID=A0A8J8W5Z4_9EURO|nr:Uncharacterized protein PECM_004199 [Penicillium ucsense]KAF7736366.1 Uncharacterized protein PECH_005469 [Penicillium ucsense]